MPREVRTAQALGAIIRNLNQSLELERVVGLIARYATELLSGTGARVWTLNDDETFTLSAADGIGTDAIGDRVPAAELFAGEAVRERRAVRTTDLRLHTTRGRTRPETFGGEHANAVAAPLLVGGRPIGAVVVFGSERGFEQDDEQLLFTLADHAAAAIENARLYRAAARTARHASIVSDAARTLAASVTPESVYAGLARVAKGALQASGVSVFLADPETLEVTPAHADGSAGADTDVERDWFWELEGGRVVREARPIFHTYTDVPTAPARMPAVRGVARLPLVVEGSPRGLLTLHFAHAKTFDEGERRLLSDFAAQVSVAMRNASLFTNLKLRAARLTAVAQRQHHISAAVSRDDVRAETYRAVAAVTDATTFALLSGDDEGGCTVPEYVVVDGVVQPAEAPLPDSLGGEAVAETWRSGTPRVLSRRVHGRPLVELCVPMTYGGRRIGVVQTTSPRLGAYDLESVDVVTIVARQAAASIENARLFAAQRLERERAEAAAAVAAAALEVAGVREGAERILDVIGRVLPLDGIALSVVRDDALECVAGAGSLTCLYGDRIPLSESVALTILQPDEGMPVSSRVPSLRAVSRPERAAQYPDTPATIVQLVARGRSLGMLGATRAAALGEGEVGTLERLAPTVALALDALLLEEQQRRQQDRERVLAAALATMQQPVFVLAADRRISYANAAAVREYGYTLGELTGMSADALVAGGGAVSAGEQLHRRADGSDFPASVVFGLIDGDGSGAHVLSVRNLTSERRVAETLRQTEKLAALGELVAGVAHELNNPLTGISAFTELLMEEELTADQLDSLRMIKRESDRAVGVIRDLLVFSRKTGPRDVLVDVNALVLHTVRLRGYGLKSAGIAVETDLAPDLPPARGDDQKLQQVLLNLVVNAEYAMQRVPDRRLKISTRLVETSSLELRVSDSGTGMSAETQKHIFEPFFTTKPAGVGTGLGLSVSYGIVQAHGGTIVVESAPDAGTTFRILLPVASARDA